MLAKTGKATRFGLQFPLLLINPWIRPFCISFAQMHF